MKEWVTYTAYIIIQGYQKCKNEVLALAAGANISNLTSFPWVAAIPNQIQTWLFLPVQYYAVMVWKGFRSVLAAALM